MTDRAAYLAFLDAELSSIQAEGKPVYSEPAETLAQEVTRAIANTAAAKYPGRLARVEADRRWGEIQRLEKAAAK